MLIRPFKLFPITFQQWGYHSFRLTGGGGSNYERVLPI